MNDAVITRKLVKKYGRFCALNGFTLSVPANSVLGLVGRNGAGKTTWMMSIAGFVRPTSGEINVLGGGPFDAARHSGKVGILPQDSELPLDECPRNLLIRYGVLQGLKSGEAVREADSLLAAFNLREKSHSSVKSLSHGMRKRVMVAQAFLGSPKLVLLDEPLSGLDPVEADRMRSYIRSRRGRQTIVISSHQLEDIEKLCTHVAFVADGKVECVKTLASLTSDSGRVVYHLRRPPNNIDNLKKLIDGATLMWNEGAGTLIIEFDATIPPEVVNERLLPTLLPFGVISISAGRSLEQAYLNRH